MSSNIITIYGIAGASGSHLAKAFDGWKSRTMSLAQKQRATRDFEHLFSRLRNHATAPPIVFYRSYADTRLFPGALLDVAFGRKGRRFKEVQFDTWAVCVSSRVIGKEAPRLRAIADKLKSGQVRELRWFCTAIADCHEAMAWFGLGHVFIHIAPIGMSIDGAEIIESLDSVAPWIKVRANGRK